MENFSRRELIKFALGLPLLSAPAYAHINNKVRIVLPEKPFEYFVKKGKERGGRVLIIGGIHGNEIGAYKAADILADLEVKKGTLIVVPRSNFTSVIADVRGYNGDMNRKFKHISKKDPDYKFVENLKQLILTFRPDVVLSLHDGYGFHILNPNRWGQCIVIDEIQYKNFPLFKIAKFVSQNANKKITKRKYKIPVYNTQTFSSDKHKEQRKALTGWCLKNNIPAFCLEASKQLPSVKEKIKTHFYMLEEFFKIYNIEIEPGFSYVLKNIKNYLKIKNPVITAKINGKIININKKQILKIHRGAKFKIHSMQGGRGIYTVPDDINLNLESFYIRKYLTFHVKNDYKKLFDFAVKVI